MPDNKFTQADVDAAVAAATRKLSAEYEAKLAAISDQKAIWAKTMRAYSASLRDQAVALNTPEEGQRHIWRRAVAIDAVTALYEKS